MKRKLLLLMLIPLLGLMSLKAQTCQHSVELVDEWGDGWNGGTLTIKVNGSPVLTNITLADGTGPEIHYFDAATGDDIDADYTAGTWSNENEYIVKDGGGSVLGQSGQGSATPVDILNMVGNCPACLPPTGQSETNITTSTADLGWTTGGATTWDIEWGPAGFTQGAGTTITGTTTNPYPLAGLTAGNSYDWYVRDDCGGDLSDWTGPGTFSTLCNAITSFPYFEGFENGGLIPDCWSQSFETGTINWGFQAGGHNGHPAAPAGGSYNALLYSPSFTDRVTKLITPALDLSGATFPHLIFKHAQAVWPSDQDELRVYYKTSAGGTWTLLPGAEWTGNIPDWTTEMFALPDPSADYYIAFEGTAKYGYGVVIDDVRIEATPPVPLSNWAIYLGIFFIGATMVFHFVRRRLA
ncbi:MAG: hypothetical protein CO098_08025 [Bacteroidetes bacterium CG_4_9_14_3_um_filter_41_19]|nr:MAG: hypothetical protein CO098_08025 [Bacteroidetes bacterium CG_4_9_14_3_um_filter_41_19]